MAQSKFGGNQPLKWIVAIVLILVAVYAYYRS